MDWLGIFILLECSKSLTINIQIMKNQKIAKRILMVLLAICFVQLYAQNSEEEKNDLYIIFLPEDYKNIKYESDFEKTFESESDKRNFQKLRTYLKNKKSLLESVSNLLEKLIGSEEALKYYKTQKKDLEKKIEGQIDTLSIPGISLYLYEYGTYDSFYDKITAKKIRDEIIPVLDTAIVDQKRVINQRNLLQKNVARIKQDIVKCEEQIEIALTPEQISQEFRRTVSLNFTLLIGLLLIGFFTIIYFKSDATIGKEFLGDNGLQFVTLFVLVIAIILFGILGILEGRELAAILSGISGYILGKGINNRASQEKRKKDENKAPGG